MRESIHKPEIVGTKPTRDNFCAAGFLYHLEKPFFVTALPILSLCEKLE